MLMQDYATTLLAHMGVHGAQVSLVDGEQEVRVEIQTPEEDSGMMIGRRGETIEALQRILSLAFRDELGEKRLTVAVNDYLDRRREVVDRIAAEALEAVLANGQPATLPYLSSDERRYVHTLMKDKGVDTRSDGMGRDRRLTVFPVGYFPTENIAQHVPEQSAETTKSNRSQEE